MHNKIIIALLLTCSSLWAAENVLELKVQKIDLDKVQLDNVSRKWGGDKATLKNSLWNFQTHTFSLVEHGELLKKIAKAAIAAHEDAQLRHINQVKDLLNELSQVNNGSKEDQKEGSDNLSENESE